MTHSKSKQSIETLAFAMQPLHRKADLLQSFSAQSKRKLSRTKALEQAAMLEGYKDYQTAKAALADTDCSTNKPDGFSGSIAPWDSGSNFSNGRFEIKVGDSEVSVRLSKEGCQGAAIEVLFEMDSDLPRAVVYTPEDHDSPVFSIHVDQVGSVLEYMNSDDEMYHKSRADETGIEMINRVSQEGRSVWFVPSPR